MRHTREEVVDRTVREFELLETLVAGLPDEAWTLPVHRPQSKDPWTVKDALVHITYWKADAARSARKQRRPIEERGLTTNNINQLVYIRWRDSPAIDVLAWHRHVQEDLLMALREAPDAWFSGRERQPPWPQDLDGHSAEHRVRDIELALTTLAELKRTE
jgi:hypothetical protein